VEGGDWCKPPQPVEMKKNTQLVGKLHGGILNMIFSRGPTDVTMLV